MPRIEPSAASGRKQNMEQEAAERKILVGWGMFRPPGYYVLELLLFSQRHGDTETPIRAFHEWFE